MIWVLVAIKDGPDLILLIKRIFAPLFHPGARSLRNGHGDAHRLDHQINQRLSFIFPLKRSKISRLGVFTLAKDREAPQRLPLRRAATQLYVKRHLLNPF
jgi:hypothetical protein